MAVVLYPEVPSIPEGLQQLLDDVSRACFQAEGIDEALFSVRIVDEETIHRLNPENPQGRPAHGRSVLSGNQLPRRQNRRDCPRLLKREYDPDSGMVYLGDCVISLPRLRPRRRNTDIPCAGNWAISPPIPPFISWVTTT